MINSDINLALPEVPDQLIKPEIAIAVAPMHYAMHALHKGASMATGAWRPMAAEWPTISLQQTLLAGKMRKCYLIAAVNINAGQLVYINGAGQMALASAAAAATLAQGICLQNVLLGATGEFMLFEGLVGIAGIVAGTKYYSQNAAGAIGVAAGAVPQLIGVGVAANQLYIRMHMQ